MSSAIFSLLCGVWLPVPLTSPDGAGSAAGKEPHEDESWDVAVPGHCHCPCPAYLVWVLQGCALVGGSTAPPVPKSSPLPWLLGMGCGSVGTACHRGGGH